MTLQQMRYFIEIVKYGSINEAAKNLFLSQPSLSSAVREMEKELGFKLFLRNNRGIDLSAKGTEFLGYAKQVMEQMELLEMRYLEKKPSRQVFSVSTQHYSFAVNAFVNMIKKKGYDEYEFALRETRTYEIIQDVRLLKSEIGIVYLSGFNTKVFEKLFRENNLVFNPLFVAEPHVFVSRKNPISKKKSVKIDDLAPYPYLAFEQGQNNSFYFSEEILSTVFRKKSILVSDRATLFNLLIGLNGYTISTGIISVELNGSDIVSVPLESDEFIKVGYISHKNAKLSQLGEVYIEEMKKVITENGFSLTKPN